MDQAWSMGLGASLVESYSRLMEPPLRVMRWALLSRRSRMASPKVGSPITSCQVLDGELGGEDGSAAGVSDRRGPRAGRCGPGLTEKRGPSRRGRGARSLARRRSTNDRLELGTWRVGRERHIQVGATGELVAVDTLARSLKGVGNIYIQRLACAVRP